MHQIEGKTEKEVYASIEKVINKVARRFPFAYHTQRDIKQQCWIYALISLPNYKPSLPLENFIYRCVYNGLLNYKRDTYKRPHPPCSICRDAIDGATAHEDRRYCKKYLKWYNRNSTISNISSALSIDNIDDRKEKSTFYTDNFNLETDEILEKIDNKLPVNMRRTYLQVKEGLKVSRLKKQELELEIMNILDKEEICQTRI